MKKAVPQGLKPSAFFGVYGTTKVVPIQSTELRSFNCPWRGKNA
jgi:hypothetical protein